MLLELRMRCLCLRHKCVQFKEDESFCFIIAERCDMIWSI